MCLFLRTNDCSVSRIDGSSQLNYPYEIYDDSGRLLGRLPILDPYVYIYGESFRKRQGRAQIYTLPAVDNCRSS